jgi:hypothetical protein
MAFGERLGAHGHRAPADATRHAERLELIEVTADGHLADAELDREPVDTHGAGRPDPLFDQVEPLVLAAGGDGSDGSLRVNRE